MTLVVSALFFLISFFLFSFLAWDYPLLSPDEPRYAETAREMIENSGYILPYLDGIPRLVKPVLFYWFEVLSFKAFGFNEYAARLPSIIASSALVALAYIFGSINRVGILTATITMTSFAVYLVAKLAITDSLLCFFISASLVFFYIAFDQNSRREKSQDHSFSFWVMASVLMMGFGFLTKGPLAFLLPILIIFIFLFFKADPMGFVQKFALEIFVGFVFAVLLNLPWYTLIHIVTNGAFTEQFFFSDNVMRFVKAHTDHSGPFWFYLPVLLIGFFPWSFFLFQSITAQDFSSSLSLQSEKTRQNNAYAFSLTWALVVLVFFSLAQTKMPTYIMPIYMPLAFLVARWWQQRFSITRSQNSRNFGLLWGLLAFLFLVVVAFLVYLFKIKEEFNQVLVSIEPNGFLLASILLASIYFAATAIALTSVFRNAKISFAFFIVSHLACLLIFTNMIFKPFVEYRDGGSKAFAQQLSKEAELKTLICHPSRFSFYSSRLVQKINAKEIKAYFASNPGSEKFLVSRTKDITRLEKRSKKDEFNYEELDSNRIYSYIKAN